VQQPEDLGNGILETLLEVAVIGGESKGVSQKGKFNESKAKGGGRPVSADQEIEDLDVLLDDREAILGVEDAEGPDLRILGKVTTPSI